MKECETCHKNCKTCVHTLSLDDEEECNFWEMGREEALRKIKTQEDVIDSLRKKLAYYMED